MFTQRLPGDTVWRVSSWRGTRTERCCSGGSHYSPSWGANTPPPRSARYAPYPRSTAVPRCTVWSMYHCSPWRCKTAGTWRESHDNPMSRCTACHLKIHTMNQNEPITFHMMFLAICYNYKYWQLWKVKGDDMTTWCIHVAQIFNISLQSILTDAADDNY